MLYFSSKENNIILVEHLLHIYIIILLKWINLIGSQIVFNKEKLINNIYE
jgi:hypothetical protein